VTPDFLTHSFSLAFSGIAYSITQLQQGAKRSSAQYAGIIQDASEQVYQREAPSCQMELCAMS